MTIKSKITEDMKVAMKAKDKKRTSVLRMILSEMKYAAAATDASVELSDDDALAVIKKYHKRLTKSLEDYPEGEKQDEIKNEIAIITDYMPKMATAEEIESAVDEILKGVDTPQFGVIMKKTMERFGKNADGKTISAIVKQKLG